MRLDRRSVLNNTRDGFETMPTLETPRLILRPLRQEDAPMIQKYFGCWEVIQHLSSHVPWPYPDDAAEQFVAGRLAEVAGCSDIIWAITERGNDSLIGVLDYIAEDQGMGNRGFWLGVPWHGRGYMTEAILAFQEYAFKDLKLERVVVENSVDNPASRRIKEKTGARFVGVVAGSFSNGGTQSERWEVTQESWADFCATRQVD
jgi:ribosomal-protein-alanine N-acetyltransferase